MNVRAKLVQKAFGRITNFLVSHWLCVGLTWAYQSVCNNILVNSFQKFKIQLLDIKIFIPYLFIIIQKNKAMKAVTLHGKSIKDIEDQIAKAISKNYQPTLAIIFADISFNLEELSKIFRDDEILIFGASSSNQNIEGEEILEQSIVAMLLDINKNDFVLYHEQTKNNNTYEISKNAARFAKAKYKNPAMIAVTSSAITDGVSVVEGINDEMKRIIPFNGGMAGGDLQTLITYIFTNNKLIDDGALFLIINNDKIKVSGIASSGWETVGIEKTITKAKGNIVYTIDDQPALDIFLKYYNIKEESIENGILDIAAKYPLQIIQEGKQPVLRGPMFANKEDRSMLFGGRIPEGAKAKFSIQPSFEIIDKTINEVKSLQTKAKKADALLMFSCGARYTAFGPLMEDEVKGIKDIWDAPLAGFFSWGEYGNALNEATNYHNETCILVVLEEK